MYAQGVYTMNYSLLECVHESDQQLMMFTNCDVALDELISPLYKIIEKVKKGLLPVYVAREMYEQTTERLYTGHYPALNYIPDWEDWDEDDDFGVDIWIEEEPTWAILIYDNEWRAVYPTPGDDHGFDPLVIIDLAGKDIEFVALIDWEHGTCTVVRSPYIGPRQGFGHGEAFADAEIFGDIDTYVLPPAILEDWLQIAIEQERCHYVHKNPQDILSEEEVLQGVENECGFIPGSLPSRYIGVPTNTGRNGLVESHAATY